MLHQQLVLILFSAVLAVVFSGGARNTRQASPAVMYGPPGFTAGVPLGQSGGYGGAGASCRSSNVEDNKRLVWALYKNVFVEKHFETVAEYFDTNVIEHNPMFRDGVEGQRESGNSAAAMSNFQLSDTQRMSGEGDFVWVHYRIDVPGQGRFACVDIFRFNCEGKIQEHWDVCQDTNVMSVNDHPFF